MQSEAASLPAGEEESAGHVEHVLSAVAPLAAEYLPASHATHMPVQLHDEKAFVA